MYVVKHEFEDKFTGQAIKVGTIVELEEGERKDYLLENQLVAEAEVVKLPNRLPADEEVEDLSVKEIKGRLDQLGIEYDKKAKKDDLMKLLEEAE